MVFAARPVTTWLKAPVPLPMAIFVSEVNGSVVIAYTIPLSVTVAPPSLVTLPPMAALVQVTFAGVFVVTFAGEAHEGVVKDIWFPYDVPALFVA